MPAILPPGFLTQLRRPFVSVFIRRWLLTEGAWVAAGQLLSGAALLGGMRLLTELCPPDVYGAVGLLSGLLIFASGMFCVPQIQAALRFYPDLVALGREREVRQIVGRSLLQTTLLLCGIMLLGAVVAGRQLAVSYWALVPLALLLPIDTFRTFELDLLNAARQQRGLALWKVADALSRPFCAVLSVWLWGPSVATVLGGYAVGSGGITLLLVWAVRRASPRGHARYPADRVLARQILRYCLPLMPLAIVAWINALLARYVIAGFAGLGAAGVYAAGSSLIGQGMTLVCSRILITTFRPIYFQAVVRQDVRQERRVLATWLWSAAGLCATAIVAVWLLGPWLTRLTLAPEYQPAAGLLTTLAIGFSFMVMAEIYQHVSLAFKRPHFVLCAEAAGAAGFVCIGIPLIVLLGSHGAALATCVSYSSSLLLSYVFSQRLRRPWIAARSCTVLRRAA